MAHESKSNIKPPYVSFVTFKNFLAGLKGAVIPARVDKGLMSGMSGGTQTYLLAALKYLQLIKDDGTPTPYLQGAVNDDKAVWAKIVKEGYSFIFESEVDLETGTEMQVLELFGAQGLTGDTRRKCLSFFSACCELGGIELGPHIKGKTSAVPSMPTRRKPRRRRGERGQEELLPAPPAQTLAPKSAKEILLGKFPEFDPNWSDELKGKWFEGFEKLIKTTTESP